MRPLIVPLGIAMLAFTVEAQQPCTVRGASAWLQTRGTFLLDGVRVGNGPRRTLQIDTGSTGIAIGSMHVETSTPLSAAEIERFQLRPNYISYDSSDNVPVGQWVWTSVRLPNGVMIPRVPVLAVHRMCKAQPGSIAPDERCVRLPPVTGACTPRNENRDPALAAVCRLGMMGVGFDRGPSMGTWQVNPFLNAQPMADGTMQRGYIVTKNGVTLGMSASAIAGFRVIPLTQIEAPYEWMQAAGCIAISGGGIVDPGQPICGNVLMDTGVDEMFVSYAAASMPSFRPPIPGSADLWNCPPVSGRVRPCNHGAPKTSVRVTWPDAAAPLFTYAVSTPQRFSPAGATPSRLHVRNAGTLPNPAAQVFVNTGRQLLQTADYLYDATCGRIGFRPATETQ